MDFIYSASKKTEGYLRLFSLKSVLIKKIPVTNNGSERIDLRSLPWGRGVFSIKVNGVNYSRPVVLDK
jgi:hypothetical protein